MKVRDKSKGEETGIHRQTQERERQPDKLMWIQLIDLFEFLLQSYSLCLCKNHNTELKLVNKGHSNTADMWTQEMTSAIGLFNT